MARGDPVVWVTSFEMRMQNVKSIDWKLDRPPIDFVHETKHQHVPIDPPTAPEYVFFALRNIPERQKGILPDLMMINGGVFLMSEAFRNLLAEFELGGTQVFEVKLLENDQKTRRPGRWFILHIAEVKDNLVPEACEGLEEMLTEGYFSVPIRPDPPVIALRPAAATGAELWCEKRLSTRLFLSDRLKRAIKAEKMRIRSFPLQKAVVVA